MLTIFMTSRPARPIVSESGEHIPLFDTNSRIRYSYAALHLFFFFLPGLLFLLLWRYDAVLGSCLVSFILFWLGSLFTMRCSDQTLFFCICRFLLFFFMSNPPNVFNFPHPCPIYLTSLDPHPGVLFTMLTFGNRFLYCDVGLMNAFLGSFGQNEEECNRTSCHR